jgi:CBS domain-containing protein
MRVEGILPAVSKRRTTVRDDAPLTDAAKLLRDPDADLVVVCNAENEWPASSSKTDVRQISDCRRRMHDARIDRYVGSVLSCRPPDPLQCGWR